MIRILHTIDTTGPGGAETVFVNLVKGLDRQRFEPTVVIRGPGWVCDELVKNGIIPIFVESKGSINFKYLFELVKVIKKYRIDLVQSHLLGSNLYSSIAGLICGVPVISTFHGFVDINSKERFASIKSRLINSGSAKLVFVSDKLKKCYVAEKGFSAKKSVTIYNGVDTNLFRPKPDDSIREKLGVKPGNILVGAVGNIRPAKGYKYLLEAAKLVVSQHPKFRFVVAGQGDGKLYDSLMVLRKELGLEEHFFFIGFEPDIARFMNNLDIFVLPSISEGFSISTIEAMACGVPVIATMCGGPEEIIDEFECNPLVKTHCPVSLCKAIIDTSNNVSITQNLVTRCNEIVRTRFSNNRMIELYTDSYNNILYKQQRYNLKLIT